MLLHERYGATLGPISVRTCFRDVRDKVDIAKENAGRLVVLQWIVDWNQEH
jgi:hypothetical protein